MSMLPIKQTPLFDPSNIGWIAGIVAAIAYGSFGVPVKSLAAAKIDAHPLVVQTYKSGMTFLLSFCILLLPGYEFQFSAFLGTLSGLFWVPGGTAGIFAIRSAGLAISVGIWSSLNVISSFIWGIFVFRESVRSKTNAFYACIILIAGLWGMSFYSDPSVAAVANSKTDQIKNKGGCEQASHHNGDKHTPIAPMVDLNASVDAVENGKISALQPVFAVASVVLVKSGMDTLVKRQAVPIQVESNSTTHGDSSAFKANSVDPQSKLSSDDEEALPLISSSLSSPITTAVSSFEIEHEKYRKSSKKSHTRQDQYVIFGMKITEKNLGFLCAFFNGFWGGSQTIPLHFSELKGLEFVISFAIGSAIVTLCMWISLFGYHFHTTKSLFGAYKALPSMHFRAMWFPGACTGVLYCTGLFSTILSITCLGQGVGNSLCQLSMIVSGLWGVFYFDEIRGFEMISKWFASAGLALIGILWLSHEHVGGASHR
mmetsp:Transcript_8823/g.12987  ORF Transcript_8823/g.12987 Transcript_8823/m.12987 type:complete len:484 (+) Transcript_8823:50-1501(+)